LLVELGQTLVSSDFAQGLKEYLDKGTEHCWFDGERKDQDVARNQRLFHRDIVRTLRKATLLKAGVSEVGSIEMKPYS
jgi:hypothetical protein